MTYPDGGMVSYTYDAMNRRPVSQGLDGDVTATPADVAGGALKPRPAP